MNLIRRFRNLCILVAVASNNPILGQEIGAEIFNSVPLVSSTDASKEVLRTLYAGDQVILLDYDDGYVLVRLDSTTTGWIYDSRLVLTDSTIAWIEKHGGENRIMGLIEGQLGQLPSRSSEYAGSLLYRFRKSEGLILWVENEDSSESSTITYSINGETSQQEAYSSIWWRKLRYVPTGAFVYISAQKGEGRGAIHVEILFNGEQIAYNSSYGQFSIASTSATAEDK